MHSVAEIAERLFGSRGGADSNRSKLFQPSHDQMNRCWSSDERIVSSEDRLTRASFSSASIREDSGRIQIACCATLRAGRFLRRLFAVFARRSQVDTDGHDSGIFSRLHGRLGG